MGITKVTPRGGIPGTAVVVDGTLFGATEGTLTVDGIAATVSAWSDIQISFTVPVGVSRDGNFILRIVRDDLTLAFEEQFWVPATDPFASDVDYQYPNTEVGVTQNLDLPRRAEAATFNRLLDMILSGGFAPAVAFGSIVRPYTAGVMVRDVVYQKLDGTVDRADATSITTGGTVLGVVSAIDAPTVGDATIIFLGDVTGYTGLSTGELYILATSPGAIVREQDITNLNYPDNAGNIVHEIGIASSSTVLFVNTTRDFIVV